MGHLNDSMCVITTKAEKKEKWWHSQSDKKTTDDDKKWFRIYEVKQTTSEINDSKQNKNSRIVQILKNKCRTHM